MENYWDTVKHEYNESEITRELFIKWVNNTDPIRMTQIYSWTSLISVFIPNYIKINYGE